MRLRKHFLKGHIGKHELSLLTFSEKKGVVKFGCQSEICVVFVLLLCRNSADTNSANFSQVASNSMSDYDGPYPQRLLHSFQTA